MTQTAVSKNIQEWLEKIARLSYVRRIWEKDASLWTKDPAGRKEAGSRLGWLTCVKKMKEEAGTLSSFSEEVRAQGFSHVVLLGMGGSSLASEVFQTVFGGRPGYPALVVLDSTDPARIQDIENKIDIQKSLFIVSSKSGGTIELVSLFKYFFEKVKSFKNEKAGEHFAAITDPGTPLEELGKRLGFRRIFPAPEDVGGRFSALTYFGLVPASLIGVDVQKILESAEKAMEDSSPGTPISDNAAALLGVQMAVLAEEGRDKLTIVTSNTLESFGDWAEQLIAESTGKEGFGIIPVVREPLGGAEAYGEDRFFVALLLEPDDNAALLRRLGGLEEAGHPVLIFKMKEKTDLGAEFFRWEMATAIACALLKVNAFDQPDVQAAKDSTKVILKKVEGGGKLSVIESSTSLESLRELIDPEDYIGILAFLPDRPEIKNKLLDLQAAIRDLTKKAVTLGIGPRYLHSTGQLHKGGPNTGIFILITAAHAGDLAVPGDKFSFAELELAQATGDLEALEQKGRRVVHVRLPDLSPESLDSLCAGIKSAFR